MERERVERGLNGARHGGGRLKWMVVRILWIEDLLGDASLSAQKGLELVHVTKPTVSPCKTTVHPFVATNGTAV